VRNALVNGGWTITHNPYPWLPFLMGWALKSVMLRYGGMRLYRAALPFFLGLILGDYVVPAFWAVYGVVTDQRMYMAFPH
jgi:hypothetical protein